MRYLDQFTEFLKGVNLKEYRAMYSHIKIVEMDLPRTIQAIELLYQVYWKEKNFISFQDFYNRYEATKDEYMEEFRIKTTMCAKCFYRGIKARAYRTWAGLITQIHAGYVAEAVFGERSVDMSAELDHKGADIRVIYRGFYLNYQVKKTSYSGVKSGRPLARHKTIKGQAIDIFYEVPSCLTDPRTLKGEYRKPYLRFLEDKRTKALENGFVIFTPHAFTPKKDEIDQKLRNA